MAMLTDLSLDLQIHICEFLHPIQILTLRQTCKTFHEATSQRIVWIHALNRICHENFLFLPTFPIADMSNAELERAAITPCRWIRSSSSKDRDGDECLSRRTLRVIERPFASMAETLQLSNQSLCDLYLVPGGRYLVAHSCDSIGVWDLGYVSDHSDVPWDGNVAKMWPIALKNIGNFRVHPTPDGLGIRILASSELRKILLVFEIYPQREAPKLEKVAELILDILQERFTTSFLNGNRISVYNPRRRAVMVWDFVADTVASWSIIGSPTGFITHYIIKVTETSVVLLRACPSGCSLWIFQIPPLTKKTPVFDINEILPEVAPILTIEFPEFGFCQIPDGWYHGDLSSLPIYIDVFDQGQFGRQKLDIASDFSNVSYGPIVNVTMQRQLDIHLDRYWMPYRICEDTSVNVFHLSRRVQAMTVGFDPCSESLLHGSLRPLSDSAPYTRSFCPASARLVHAHEGNFVISDF